MHAHSPNNPRAPLVLACGFTALLAWSGVRPKLAALKHWPSVIQTKLRYSSTQQGIVGAYTNSWVPTLNLELLGFIAFNPTYPRNQNPTHTGTKINANTSF